MRQSRVDKIAEKSEMKEALTTVLSQYEEKDSVSWQDVRNEITSGEWGRLIETGILEDADNGDGFIVADPKAVRNAVDDIDQSSDSDSSSVQLDDVSTTEWTIYDKLAAVGSIGLFAGYSISQVRNIVGSAVDIFLGPINSVVPFYVMILIAAMITGLYSTLLQDNLMNMEKMGAYQQRMKDIQQRQKEAKERGDEEAQQRIREEQMDAMGDQVGMFKEQFRPMVWTMFITIPVFLWMYWMIGPGKSPGHLAPGQEAMVMPLIGSLNWTDSVLGPMQAWIVWYFLCSMAFTQLIRKSLNIQTTPT
ncbi:DUF106 domain-containing protein [Haladaptatus halobius]|uniref:DUF106 domain-containing protein n=1 Tax=Haladaptatus halobius TaxID=2884875 RepID=UPI001D09B708|nr:DUF106 domain-containing protein [Haladaptatus halobius]